MKRLSAIILPGIILIVLIAFLLIRWTGASAGDPAGAYTPHRLLWRVENGGQPQC